MATRPLVALAAMPLLVAGCELHAEMGGAASPAGAPPPPPTAAETSAGPIQAGCSYNATQLPADALGTSYQVACPSGCESSGGLWGTDIYTADSAICRAGIYAGAISPGGGVVTVQTQPGRPAYRGSARNGIQSSDYGSYGKSYAVINTGSATQARTSAPAASQVIEAGCSYNATQIEDAPGTAHVVSCPAGCAGSGGLWGTDVYTADSGICKAAVHAGLLTDRGGTVAVILDAGRPAYRGSSRNGITSWDYGSYAKSFRLQRP